MRTVEVRDLDGPNLFLMEPTIKVEVGDIVHGDEPDVIRSLKATITRLHESAGVLAPTLTSRVMEEPGHIVVAFAWEKRAFSRSVGAWAAALVTGERTDEQQIIMELREILRQPPADDDAPLVIRASPDRMPIVAITGTNGKTTTSRMIAFALRHAGYHVGLTSSAGVFIDSECVIAGDYSGPSGARHVLAQPNVDYAVLETARGGLLLRGAGYDQADVGVVTNVSEDHLGLHGIHSLAGLADVKAIIARNVKPDGYCVLNADDPNVLAMKSATPAKPLLFSASGRTEAIDEHIRENGAALFVAEGAIAWVRAGEESTFMQVADIPSTFGGRAQHQVQNALAAIGALLGLNLSLDQIREGMHAFRSTAENSQGRLNLFEVNNGTVIIDFAHNAAGLNHLLNFASTFLQGDGKLMTVIGTAGDREDSALRAIARRAAETSDVIVLKDSLRYLRGRESGDMTRIMREGIASADRSDFELLEAPDERSATLLLADRIQPGDVLAVMCVEDYDFLLQEMSSRGTPMA